MKRLFFITLAILGTVVVQARISLPQLFQNGMVLQREKPIPVWGNAQSGATVKVTFRKKTYTATADAQGRWQVVMPAQKAGGPYELAIAEVGSGESTVLTDVLVGDVWLCSGQSNIDVTVERVHPQYDASTFDYENDRIRLFRVERDFETHGPRADIRPTNTHWSRLNRQNSWLFSAVGYFLGREMFRRNGVPQGVIVNSVGGSPIQAWLDADTLMQYWPQEFARTKFYQNDAMVNAMQEANMQASNQWRQQLDSADPGLTDHYADNGYDDSHWPLVDVLMPRHRSLSNDGSNRPYHGSFWARQNVNIDAAHAGKEARLLVGTLFDADQTYVNGQLVGTTGYQYPPRRYTIPAGVLQEGSNSLAVRLITQGGTPHFIPDKPYKLVFADGTEVALKPQWRIHQGAQMPSCPQMDAGGQNLPSVLYNAMLHPLAPYGLAGVVWYQGESNTGDGNRYAQLLQQLINGWRQLWQQKSDVEASPAKPIPFVVVQLANFMEPSERPQDSGWSYVREAQRRVADKMEQTELAVIIDLGETVDIHPLRKQEVAERIARCFDHLIWHPGTKLSPQVVDWKVSDAEGCITLELDQPLQKATTATPMELFEFEVAAADGVYTPAKATGSGKTISIVSPVKQPQRLRYAWKNNPLKANVFSLEGLPLSPFQLDLNQ